MPFPCRCKRCSGPSALGHNVWTVHKAFATTLLLFAVGSSGCNRNRVSASSVEGQIGHAIEERCPKTTDCPIRLRDVTSFDWDKMFYFDYAVPPAEREKAVGFELETEEFSRQLVFLRGGSIVRNDLLPTDIERPIKNEIVFESEKPAYRITCDNEARFTATRGDGGTGIVSFHLKSMSDHCR
jgi:hypothetical protein